MARDEVPFEREDRDVPMSLIDSTGITWFNDREDTETNVFF